MNSTNEHLPDLKSRYAGDGRNLFDAPLPPTAPHEVGLLHFWMEAIEERCGEIPFFVFEKLHKDKKCSKSCEKAETQVSTSYYKYWCVSTFPLEPLRLL